MSSLPSAGPCSLTLPFLVQTYDIQASLQKDSQVTVSIILENQSNSFLKNMELNVLDSLNTKMSRPEGSSVHDGVPVPFQLPPGEPALPPSPLRASQLCSSLRVSVPLAQWTSLELPGTLSVPRVSVLLLGHDEVTQDIGLGCSSARCFCHSSIPGS